MSAERPARRARPARRRVLGDGFWLAALWFATATLLVLMAGPAPATERSLSVVAWAGLTLTGLLAFGIRARRRGQLDLPWLGFLFPLAFVLFHFGTAGLEHRWYAPELSARAWQVSALGLLAWLCGFDALRGGHRIPLRPLFTVGGHPLSRRRARLVAFAAKTGLLLGVSLQGVLLVHHGVIAFFTRVYGKEAFAITADNWLSYLYTLGSVVALASLVTLAMVTVATARRLLPGRIWAAVVACYLAAFLLEGDRSALTIAVVPLVAMQHYWVRRIPWRRGLVLVLAGLVLFATLKLYRGTRDPLGAIRETFTVATADMLFHEMGNTLDTVVRSIAVVPQRTDYFLGRTYLWAVARALPNLSMQPRTWGFVSSRWITDATAADVAARHGGLGFSIVAEAYINFAGVGAVVFLFALGLLSGWTDRLLARRRVELWTAVLVLLFQMSLLSHVRNTAVVFVRGFLWMACIVIVLRTASRLLDLAPRDRQLAGRHGWTPGAVPAAEAAGA